jgi:hypothetical protein
VRLNSTVQIVILFIFVCGWIVCWNFHFFTDLRAAAMSRKSSNSSLQQQTSSAGLAGRSTPTPIGAVTVPPAAPHSPISTSKANNTALTVRASEEDSSADKPTMNWEPENTEENGSNTLQNSEFNLDLDDILKIDSLPMLTVGSVLAIVVICLTLYKFLFLILNVVL